MPMSRASLSWVHPRPVVVHPALCRAYNTVALGRDTGAMSRHRARKLGHGNMAVRSLLRLNKWVKSVAIENSLSQ